MAREINAGTDWLINPNNPRLAVTLNLLTNGFGQRGSPRLRFIPSNHPSKIWSAPTPISLPDGPLSRASRSGDGTIAFDIPMGKQFRLEEANRRIFLPKLGWIRYRKSREVLGRVKNVTVSQAEGKWWVSIPTEREVDPPVHPFTSLVGIDLGMVRLATLYDGQQETVIRPRNSLRQHEARRERHQRALAPQAEVQPELEESEGSNTTHPHPDRSCPLRLLAQDLDHDQPKPRVCVWRTWRSGTYRDRRRGFAELRDVTSPPRRD